MWSAVQVHHRLSSKMHSGPGSNVTVTAPSFYTFKPDGTYIFKGIAGVDAESTVSSQETQITGTYTVRDT
jgi:hypothetical protein